MADFEKAFSVLMGLEFNNPSNFLHKNEGENDYTVAGIYKTANPNWPGWSIVLTEVSLNKGNIRLSSSRLYHNKVFRAMVAQFYRDHEWNKMRLDEIKDQNTAEEIFVFGVNAGKRTAIRKAQNIVGAKTDGLIGPMTIKALNEYDGDKFDMVFDEIEKQYYDDIIKNRRSFAVFKDGWYNRAEAV